MATPKNTLWNIYYRKIPGSVFCVETIRNGTFDGVPSAGVLLLSVQGGCGYIEDAASWQDGRGGGNLRRNHGRTV
jgi:hypothetical protein